MQFHILNYPREPRRRQQVCIPSHTVAFCKITDIIAVFRGVAQSGRVLALGARCRRFESCRPDHKNSNRPCADFNFYKRVSRFDTSHYVNNAKVRNKRVTRAVKGARHQRWWELQSCRPDHKNSNRPCVDFNFYKRVSGSADFILYLSEHALFR